VNSNCLAGFQCGEGEDEKLSVRFIKLLTIVTGLQSDAEGLGQGEVQLLC
jgi:hypothetical protein